MKDYVLSNKDVRLYLLAVDYASQSQCRIKHGAVIVKSGRFIAQACNRFSTPNYTINPTLRGNKAVWTLHAEQRAIIAAQTNIVGSTLYSARSGESLISKPCTMCSELIYEAGIRFVVYHDGETLRKVKV